MELLDCKKELGHVYYHAYRLYNSLNSEIRIHIDLQDLVQAGRVGLWDATKKYKKDSKASFTSYANIRIRGEMIDTIRKYCPLTKRMIKEKFLISFVELSEKHYKVFSYEIDTDSIDLHKSIDKVLDERGKRLINRFLEGHDKRSIAKQEGIHESYVNILIKEAMELIRVYNKQSIILYKGNDTIN